MDLEDNDTPPELNKNANRDSKNYESGESYTVNKINPFNTVGNYHRRRLDKLKSRKNSGVADTCGKTIKIPGTASTYKVVSIQESEQEIKEDAYIDQSNTLSNVSIPTNRSILDIPQPLPNLPTKQSYDSYGGSCSRSIPTVLSYGQVRYKNSYQSNKSESLSRSDMFKKPIVINERYQRNNSSNVPMHNLYNEDFVLRTMQKQARLRNMVKKLVIERQKEKQRETWNNYINELKNKHKYYSNEPTTISPQFVPNEISQSEGADYCDSRYSWNQSDPCQRLLSSFYDTCKKIEPNHYNKIDFDPRRPYTSNHCCYPTSSQGRYMMLKKERERNKHNPQSSKKYKCIDNRRRKLIIKANSNRVLSSSVNVQTDKEDVYSQSVVTDKPDQEFINLNSINKTYLRQQILQEDNPKTLIESIEEKLDILIRLFNVAMVEMREQKPTYANISPLTKTQSITCTLKSLSNLVLNKNKNDCGFQTTNEVLFATVLQNTTRNCELSEISTSTPEIEESNERKTEKLIQEEMRKSDRLKQEIENLLQTRCHNQCSAQIEFDVPTRDISTVITDSLPKAQYCPTRGIQVEEINSYPTPKRSDRQIAIAVNTEPLGLLALLQVSSETIKQLLSYLTNLNYKYLSLLQPPRRPCVAHYVCNICNATFSRPSQLSEHIENYHLPTRNCCVCRHILSLRSDRIGMFECKYCRQRFTRAYCYELHQQTCAKRVQNTRTHNLQNNLMILR